MSPVCASRRLATTHSTRTIPVRLSHAGIARRFLSKKNEPDSDVRLEALPWKARSSASELPAHGAIRIEQRVHVEVMRTRVVDDGGGAFNRDGQASFADRTAAVGHPQFTGAERGVDENRAVGAGTGAMDVRL